MFSKLFFDKFHQLFVRYSTEQLVVWTNFTSNGNHAPLLYLFNRKGWGKGWMGVEGVKGGHHTPLLYLRVEGGEKE